MDLMLFLVVRFWTQPHLYNFLCSLVNFHEVMQRDGEGSRLDVALSSHGFVMNSESAMASVTQKRMIEILVATGNSLHLDNPHATRSVLDVMKTYKQHQNAGQRVVFPDHILEFTLSSDAEEPAR